MDQSKPSFFITTPIYYVNADPHLGTAYSTIIADVQARYRRSAGYNVKFLTGMDEHGEKVAEAAAKHGMTPQEWTDSQAPHFKELWSKLEISNDDFIRTTEPRQHHAVQYLWERMKESGYLYKGSYDGWYCVPDETYFTDTQVQKGDEEYGSVGQHLCPDCHRPLERVQEESYFFKLSAFQDKLLKLYDEHPDFVEPAFRMNEVRSFVEGGLNDLSVSRTSFDWGIQVPFDEGHVTYVWFDALLNYMTAVGYGVDTDEARAELAYRWPAQFHIVGKDIIRFHCVIWPAMLMAIGEALPEHVFAHGFLTVRNAETGKAEKMSKSRGNAIAPQDVIDMLGVEGYRYYFMTDVVPGTDGAISFDRMEQVYNADLANSWGNLISRSLNMSAKYFDGCAPAKPASADAFDNPLAKIADGLVERYMANMDVLDYGGAKDEVMELIHAANHYIEDSEPWALAKDEANKPRLASVMYNLLETIRICTTLLLPFIPASCEKIFAQTGADASVQTWDKANVWGALSQTACVHKGEAIFPRIDAAKALAELAELEAEQKKALLPAVEVEPQLEEKVDFDTFCKSDLRAVKVKSCERVKKSDKLLRFTLDDGSGTDRQILSGIAKFYEPEALVGKTLAAIINLPPRKMMGQESCGMLLSAVHKEKGEEKLNLLMLNDAIPAGAKLC